MLVATIIIALGLLTNVLVFAASRMTCPRFSNKCSECGYQLPPMEYPTAINSFHPCPGCMYLSNQVLDSDNLND